VSRNERARSTGASTTRAADHLERDRPRFSGFAARLLLEDRVSRIASTPLLLIAGGRGQFEREFDLTYAKAAPEPVELWDLRDVEPHEAINAPRPARTTRRGLLRLRSTSEATRFA